MGAGRCFFPGEGIVTFLEGVAVVIVWRGGGVFDFPAMIF
jgi:hypothetical protein